MPAPAAATTTTAAMYPSLPAMNCRCTAWLLWLRPPQLDAVQIARGLDFLVAGTQPAHFENVDDRIDDPPFGQAARLIRPHQPDDGAVPRPNSLPIPRPP